jgi:nucleoid-associated protein YgaU
MANLTRHLTSISPDLESGPSPGRRLLALVLSAMLLLGTTLPGAAAAGEVDSEGEGAALPVEAPSAPDFDPGGEEVPLEEAPAGGTEEGGAVEVEIEVPSTEEVTSAAAEAVVEEPQTTPVEVPEVAPPAPEPEPVQQTTSVPVSEPVANQSIVAPEREPAERSTASSHAAPAEAAAPAEPAEEPPPPSHPVAVPADPGRVPAGKDSYVVRPGDCLSHIAAAVLSPGADALEIEEEVERLWRLNEDRIGTGDPDLIYPGTVLRLR